jgi:hypothetical protein
MSEAAYLVVYWEDSNGTCGPLGYRICSKAPWEKFHHFTGRNEDEFQCVMYIHSGYDFDDAKRLLIETFNVQKRYKHVPGWVKLMDELEEM